MESPHEPLREFAFIFGQQDAHLDFSQILATRAVKDSGHQFCIIALALVNRPEF
jgi:hypothetical protein